MMRSTVSGKSISGFVKARDTLRTRHAGCIGNLANGNALGPFYHDAQKPSCSSFDYHQVRCLINRCITVAHGCLTCNRLHETLLTIGTGNET